MRVAFAGTPAFAETALAHLHAAGFAVPLVLTQPDRPAGRGMKLHASPVKDFALAHSIALAIPAMLLAGGGFVATMTSLNVAMQLRSPEAILGRCLSLYQAIVFGAMAVGAYAWGTMADRFGLATAIRLAAGWLALTLLLRFVIPMPRREEGRVNPAFVPAPAPKSEESHAPAR